MSFVLVKWVEEAEISIAPVSWVLEPSSLPVDEPLPIDGVCYWKRKSNKYRVKILGVSGTAS